MSLTRLSLAFAVLSASLLSAAERPHTADPVKAGFKLSDFPRTVKIADNIYTYEGFHSGEEKFTTVSLILITKEGVVIVDGQGSPAETKDLVDNVKKLTPQPIKYYVVGSDHGDHTGGNTSLPEGIKFVVHPNSKATLDKAANAPNARPGTWHLPADADIVSDKKVYKLGGEEFDVMFLGRSHTGGDLAVYLPKEKVLFMSEIFLNYLFPAMRSAYPTEWLAALDKAEKMNAKLYIAGHGFTETDGKASRKELLDYHAALKAVIAESKRLHDAGVPVDQAVKQANWGEYKDWSLSSSQAAIAIRKCYEEFDGKLK